VTGAVLEEVAAPDPRPTGQPERAIEVQELYATVARLPEDFRLALVAVDVLGLSYREAARALKVREATITTRLFRARGQVARALDPELAQDSQPRQAHRGQSDREERAHREETRASGVLPSRGT